MPASAAHTSTSNGDLFNPVTPQPKRPRLKRTSARFEQWKKDPARNAPSSRPIPPLCTLDDLFSTRHRPSLGPVLDQSQAQSQTVGSLAMGINSPDLRDPPPSRSSPSWPHDILPKLEPVSPVKSAFKAPGHATPSIADEPSLLLSPTIPNKRSVFSHPDVQTSIVPVVQAMSGVQEPLLSPLLVASPDLYPSTQDEAGSASDSSASTSAPIKAPFMCANTSLDPPSSPPVEIATPVHVVGDIKQLRQGVEMLQRACAMLNAGLQSPVKLSPRPRTADSASTAPKDKSSRGGQQEPLSDTPEMVHSIKSSTLPSRPRPLRSSTPLDDMIATPVPEQAPCPAFSQVPMFPRAFQTVVPNPSSAFDEVRTLKRKSSLFERMRCPPAGSATDYRNAVHAVPSQFPFGPSGSEPHRFQPYHMLHSKPKKITTLADFRARLATSSVSTMTATTPLSDQSGPKRKGPQVRLGKHIILDR